ncbi:type VII secretion system-associated protein [Saccharopolyspora shandongensis]|uniref:SseB protein N-terminal domain-containing protein n=1 Tax=Saccharopolyspora shandongensis TaxID=418495 RepID=A0A1H3QT54_9PSEU|nr:type VII secretion system-associated protein [Saccharopolyspora shandongensis]SDZ16586.1 SseB protein N-terminal domain-containing protein [Saccharopolyspora shandongensis]
MIGDPVLPDEDRWVFLIDPAWQEQGGDPQRPPREAVVGGWHVEADGTTGRFHANPDYVPSTPNSPTDPVDATLRLVNKGEADADALLATLREAAFGIAVDEDQNPVIAPAPDGVASMLVTTSPAHRKRVQVEGWREATAAELADALPEEGVDVLINPGSPASMRLLASALRRAVG